MKIATSLMAGLLAVPLAAVGTTLQVVDNGLGVYDPSTASGVTGVTWTSDANLMATQAAIYSGGASAFVSAVIADSGGLIHDTPNAYDKFIPNSGIYSLTSADFNTTNGQMTWWGAQAWVNYLNAIDYGNSTQWALPTTVDNGSSLTYPPSTRPPTNSSQMASLFFGQLEGTYPGWSFSTVSANATAAGFKNLQNYEYYSGTEWSGAYTQQWSFNAGYGFQGYYGKGVNFNALAVSPGEIGTPVPLPASAWLLLSALGGLGFATLKRKMN